MGTVFLLFATLYMLFRVYKSKKRFSKAWIKEFGAQNENIVGFAADKERPDGKDERTGIYKVALNKSNVSVKGVDNRLSGVSDTI